MDSQSAELIALRSKAPSLYHYNFATILTAITKEKIIPTFTLRKCMQIAESNGLSGLLQSQECKDLVSFFESIGLPPQVGYNPGTGLISLKFPLPNPRELRKPISSYSKALVFCALGLHHQQHAFEYDFINLQRTYYTLQQKHNSLQPFDIISYALDAKHVPPAHLGRGKTGCAETIYNILSSSDLIHSVTIPSRPDTSVQTELLSQLLQVSTAQGENKEKDKTNQESVENRNSSTATERVSPDQLVSLANVSLYNFFRQSHIMIANLNIDAPSQTCTLFLRPAKFGYIMNKPAKSGALHPLRPLLSFVEVSPQTNDIEYHIISQYQHYLHRIQQSESLTVSLHKGSNSTAALPSKDPKNIDNDGEYERNPEPKLSFELYQRYFFDFVIPIYKSDDSVVPFTFSPIYSLITGHNPVTMRRDTTYLQQQHKFIISLLQSYFWHYITSTERYYPTAILRTQMNTVLERYFQTGLDSFRCGFNPQLRNLSLFLWGTAGTGKSTFVRVLCATLHEIIDHIFEPGKRVEITRMPFNQTTPAALAALLMVRGISDWSLERIVEQTVSRGGLSLLHLEEQPPDPAIQDELYGLITKMTTTLVSRYPEYRHNVINILTANYPPSNDLSNTTNVIEITPPNRTTQQIWICKTAEDMIASSLVRLDTGNVRFSLSCLELCPLVQFISHPSDKPPYVTSQWPNGISGSGSGNGTNEQGNGNSTNGKGSNNITTSLNGIPALSHTFHTTIQRPLYSISARMNEPGFDQQYLTQYYKYNNLNNYSQMSSFQQHNQSSQTTPMLDTFLNFFGFETQPNKGANGSNMKQSLGNINGNVHNTPSLDDEFKYSKLLPFLQQYQYDLTMPSPLIALLPPELSSVLIGDGPHEQGRGHLEKVTSQMGERLKHLHVRNIELKTTNQPLKEGQTNPVNRFSSNVGFYGGDSDPNGVNDGEKTNNDENSGEFKRDEMEAWVRNIRDYERDENVGYLVYVQQCRDVGFDLEEYLTSLERYFIAIDAVVGKEDEGGNDSLKKEGEIGQKDKTVGEIGDKWEEIDTNSNKNGNLDDNVFSDVKKQRGNEKSGGNNDGNKLVQLSNGHQNDTNDIIKQIQSIRNNNITVNEEDLIVVKKKKKRINQELSFE